MRSYEETGGKSFADARPRDLWPGQFVGLLRSFMANLRFTAPVAAFLPSLSSERRALHPARWRRNGKHSH